MKIKTSAEIHNIVFNEVNYTHNDLPNDVTGKNWVSVESIKKWAIDYPHDTFEEFLHKLGEDSK